MRKRIAVVIALVMVATLAVSGCTSTTNTTTTNTTTTTHDAVLERMITAYKGFVADVRGRGNGTITAWQVTWPNATTVNIKAVAHYTQPNMTVSYNRTVIKFPSTEAATAYLAAYNLTGYTLSNTTTERGNVSETALGHPLNLLKVYGKVTGASHNIEVEQADNLIIVTDYTAVTTSS